MIEFFKYHGTGNDFIMIDNRSRDFKYGRDSIAYLCDRHRGIGADGLILLEDSDDYDFRMRYFNADGQEATMCGNGGRCIAAFAFRLGVTGRSAVFEAADGLHRAIITGSLPEFIVELTMADVDISGFKNDPDFLFTGSPHHLSFVEDLDRLDVYRNGAKLRYSEKYKAIGGTNVNFIKKLDENKIQVRTYERGVENETLSCGTGVTAAAIATAIRQKNKETSVEVRTKGGNLAVSFQIKDNFAHRVKLTGPAREVFRGTVEND